MYTRNFRAEKLRCRQSRILEALQKMHLLPQNDGLHLEEPPLAVDLGILQLYMRPLSNLGMTSFYDWSKLDVRLSTRLDLGRVIIGHRIVEPSEPNR